VGSPIHRTSKMATHSPMGVHSSIDMHSSVNMHSPMGIHSSMDLHSSMWQQPIANASLPKHSSPKLHRVDQQEHQKAKEDYYISTQPLSINDYKCV